MKAQILLVAVFVGVYAGLVSSRCMCPGVCVKEVTEDGECNPGPNNTIGTVRQLLSTTACLYQCYFYS